MGMKFKTTLLIIALIGVIVLAVFGFGIKEKASEGLLSSAPGYNCDNGFCTSCIINNNSCICSKEACKCGNMSVRREECYFGRRK